MKPSNIVHRQPPDRRFTICGVRVATGYQSRGTGDGRPQQIRVVPDPRLTVLRTLNRTPSISHRRIGNLRFNTYDLCLCCFNIFTTFKIGEAGGPQMQPSTPDHRIGGVWSTIDNLRISIFNTFGMC